MGVMSEFERLTWRSKSGNLYAKGWNPYTRTYEKRVENITVTSKDALKRLAEYEDSRLSPERAGDLALAETDGRLIELPVKFGDTVWCSTSDLGTITQPAECTVVFIGLIVTACILICTASQRAKI
jgi:hypothetical protein